MTDNWIVANLQAALNFFNAMMQFLYDILTINPVTYREGAIWQIVDTIYTSLLGASISLCVIFFYIGIIQDSAELIMHRRWEVILWDFVKFCMMSGLIIYGRYLLLLIFAIGKEFIDAVVLQNGSNALSAAWIEPPDRIVNATNGLSMSSGIVFWVVTLLAAIVIMVSCFSIMLVVYGRLFNIYLHISLSPPLIACAAGKSTMQWFIMFLKSFLAVCLEGLVIVVVCLIFSGFANGFDINNPIGKGNENSQIEESIDTALDEVFDEEDNSAPDNIISGAVGGLGSLSEDNSISSDEKEANAEEIWIYLGESLFLFILMASSIKAADDRIKRWLGA